MARAYSTVVVLVSLPSTFIIEGELESKKTLSEHQKILSRPCQLLWAPLVAISNFAGVAALQVVSECPQHCWADIFISKQILFARIFRNIERSYFHMFHSGSLLLFHCHKAMVILVLNFF